MLKDYWQHTSGSTGRAAGGGGGGAPGSTSSRLEPFLGTSGTAMHDVLSGWRCPARRLGAGSSANLLPGLASARCGRGAGRVVRVVEASMFVKANRATKAGQALASKRPVERSRHVVAARRLVRLAAETSDQAVGGLIGYAASPRCGRRRPARPTARAHGRRRSCAHAACNEHMMRS